MPSPTAPKSSSTIKPAAKATAPHLDSPLRTMFGLLVLWGSLGLIFWAHRESDYSIGPTAGAGPAGAPALVQSGGVAPALEAMMQSYSASLPETTPRQAVAKVAETLGLEYQALNLDDILSTKTCSFDFSGIPLNKAIHRLIDNRETGYAIQGNTLLLYRQKLESPPLDNRQIDWKAELDLSDKPISIFPSGDSDLWFTIQMIRDVNQDENPWRTMQVELWKGGERLHIARNDLDESGRAVITRSTSENISFQIERTAPAPGNRTPGRYKMILSYQSFD